MLIIRINRVIENLQQVNKKSILNYIKGIAFEITISGLVIIILVLICLIA